MVGMRRSPFPALVLVAALVGCSSNAPAPPPLPTPSPEPTFVLEDPAGTATAPDPGEGSPRIVAAVASRFLLFRRPGVGEPERYTSVNDWGQELWLPVVGTTRANGGTWFRVLIPERPNGADAWVRERDVEVDDVLDRVVVRLGARTLTRYRGDRVVRRVEVAVGAPNTPTAVGRFFVWARVGYDDPSGPYGNFALGLSGFSPVLTEWPGGGRMAIHGTADPSDAGRDISHGCVRVFNPQMERLIDLPMGTTVVIRP